jgi:type II secretory pathway component PulF
MPRFKYLALNADLQRVAGEVEADSVQHAIAQLETGGLSVQSISVADIAGADELAFQSAPVEVDDAAAAIAPDERRVLGQHLAQALAGAKALVPALRAYAQEMRSDRRRHELQRVCRLLESGDPNSAAVAFDALPEYWIPLLSAAGASKDAGRVLHQFLEESHETDELGRQWRRTLAYPFLIVCLGVAVFVVLSLLVFPVFRTMFEDFGLTLPAFTSFMLAAAQWITTWEALIAAIVIAILAIVFFLPSQALPASMRRSFRRRFGGWFGRSTALARFARFTADLLEAGVDMPSALRLASETTGAPQLQEASWLMANQLESRRVGVPPLVRNALSATITHALFREMPQGSRIRLLKEVSNGYADRVRRRLSWTHGVLGPIAIGVVGLGVGLVVLALFLPLVTLINNLS